MAKGLQDRIKDLSDYRPDIAYKDGAFILKIKFDKNWRIIEPSDDDIAYAKDDNVPNLHWYVSTIENTDKLFDLIEETIELNKEFEKKAGLYKEKVKELQELFLSDIPYDKLKTIQFVIPEPIAKPKPKTKKTQPKTQKKSEETTVSETAVVVDNTPADVNTSSEPYTGDIDKLIEQALGK